MHINVRPSFAFLAVTYNHENYIIEHLESIKYLVLTHGKDIDIDIIINDDNSTDSTCNLIDKWLNINKNIFRLIKTIYNKTNIGTCASVNNMFTHVQANRCKLTAGDDVYSFENIFELTKHEPDVAIISGRVLYLTGNKLEINHFSSFLATATQVIYKNNSLLHRFKHFSYNNAPNILYSRECLQNPNVRSHLQRFDVTEDWPLQIAIARQFPERKFQLIDQILVYYRRTAGSTYIVANQRFIKDKIQIYDDLIQQDHNWVERVRLKSRKACFSIKNNHINKLLNLDLYFFFISCTIHFAEIIFKQKKFNPHIAKHQNHYKKIQSSAIAALADIK